MSPKREKSKVALSSPYKLRSHSKRMGESLAACTPSPSLNSYSPLFDTPLLRKQELDQIIQGVHRDLDSICALHRHALQQSNKFVIETKLESQRKKIGELQEAVKVLDDAQRQSVQARDEAITCGMCLNPMDKPFIIRECSHGFCLACLRSWFQTLIYEDIRHLSFPRGLEENLRMHPYTADSLAKLYHHGIIKFPYFVCPACRQSVWERPIQVPIINNVIQALSRTYLGPPAGLVSCHVEEKDMDVWAGVFPPMTATK